MFQDAYETWEPCVGYFSNEDEEKMIRSHSCVNEVGMNMSQLCTDVSGIRYHVSCLMSHDTCVMYTVYVTIVHGCVMYTVYMRI